MFILYCIRLGKFPLRIQQKLAHEYENECGLFAFEKLGKKYFFIVLKTAIFLKSDTFASKLI